MTHDILGVQGVLEAVRISCAGYPTRRTFDDFLDRFGLLAPEVLDDQYVALSFASAESVTNHSCILG